MHSLEELVKCPICFDSFKEPRSLPCSHIFCLECLQRQEESDPTKFIKTCCICRQEINPRKKASTFPTAFLVQQMVERMHRLRVVCNQGERHRVVDQIFNLFETRKQIKTDEEYRMKQEILSKKDEITKRVEETVEKIKQYLDSEKERFLDSIDAECEKRLEKLKQFSQEADRDCKVKSWVISNIDDNFSIITPLKSVLSAKATSLALESEERCAVDVFLNSLHLDNIRRDLSEASHNMSSSPNDDTSHHRNDPVEQPEIDHSEEEDPGWGHLRSTQSDTSLVNRPVDSAAFPADTISSNLGGYDTLTSNSVQKDSNNAVSVTNYIVDNRDVSRGAVEERKDDRSDYSPLTDGGAAAVPFVSSVKIEHWEKATSHQTRSSNDGAQLPGPPQRRERISSAPTSGKESSDVTKPFVWRVQSNGSSNERASGLWKRFRRPMVLNTIVVQDIAPSKRIYVHVTSNNTTIAVDEGTKMWVFANCGSVGRRRFIFDAIAEDDTPPAIIGIASLPNDEGWCMLLKSTVLVFNYHGILNLKRSFPDTIFLSALVHSSEKFLFIDEDFRIGIAGFSGDNIDEVVFLHPSGLKLTGVILGMAAGPNMFFISHADAERNVGTISCLSGLESNPPVLSYDHEIHAPNGFHCPQSICCNQNGKLFVLWRDRDHRKGIIVEYTVIGNVVMSNITFDVAGRVRAITCSSEGRLVTCSF